MRKLLCFLVLACAYGHAQQNTPVDSFVPTVLRYHGAPPLSIPCLRYQVALDDTALNIYTCSQVGTWQLYSGGGGGGVPSVFGRTGAVVAQTNDYSFAQLSGIPTTLSGYGITNAVPNTTTVNGHALSGNISLTSSDIDAMFTGAGKCYLFKGTTPGTNDGCDNPAGAGTVTSFSSGNLSPLFTTSVATSTSTPALTFTLSTAAANTVFGNFTGSPAAPTFTAAPTFSAANLTNFPTFNQNTSGTASNLSGTPALPNGTTATTQTVGDNTTKIATDAFVLANSSGSLPSGPTSPNGVPSTLTSTPSGGVAGSATWSLGGVPVNNNSETTCAAQTLNVLDRATAIFCSGGTTSTFTLPVHTTSGFGTNFPFVTYNGNSGNMTLTPTTDTIDRGTLLPSWADFLYNNASGNWQSIQYPTFAAFGSTCANGTTWSTTTGFGCLSAAPIKSGDAAGGVLSGTYPNPGFNASSLNGTDTKNQTGTGTFTASNMACGDANGGVTPCTTTPTGMALGNGVTATTQSAGSNDTKVATDAYVDTATPLVSLDTSTPVTVSTTRNSAFYNNQNATAATAVTYNLPTAAAGKQFCFTNSNNGSAANTGVLTIATSASGQFIIFTDGTLSATGGNITSGGAAADSSCVVGVDSTHWQLYTQRGTWTKH